jgi:hypothetical protein
LAQDKIALQARQAQRHHHKPTLATITMTDNAIAYTKYYQQQQQVAALRALPSVGAIAVYAGRDPQTGDRLLQTGDGSIVRARYNGEALPSATIRNYRPGGALGIPGVFDA